MNWLRQLFGAIVLAALCTAGLCTHYENVIETQNDNFGPVPRGVENQAERLEMFRRHEAIIRRLSIFENKRVDPDWLNMAADWLDMAADKINEFRDNLTN